MAIRTCMYRVEYLYELTSIHVVALVHCASFEVSKTCYSSMFVLLACNTDDSLFQVVM